MTETRTPWPKPADLPEHKGRHHFAKCGAWFKISNEVECPACEVCPLCGSRYVRGWQH